MRVAAILVLVASTAVAVVPKAGAASPAHEPRLLLAFDEANGSLLWHAKTTGRAGGHTDAKFLAHGLVITEEYRCLSGERAYRPGDVSVVAFDARTGRERWRAADVELSPGVFGRIDPPARDVPTIPVRSTVDGTPRLLDVDSGQDRGPLAGTPVAASGDLLLVVALDAPRASASTRGIVTALDRRTGAPRWTKNLGANLFSVVADPSAVAVAAGPIPDPGTELGKLGGIEVLEPSTGRRRWAAPLLPAFGIELAGGHVVFQNLDRLRGVDVSTGRMTWDVTAAGTVDSGQPPARTLVVVRAPGPAGGVGTTRGLVSAFDPATGLLRWQHPVAGDELSPATASAGRAVVVGTGDRLVAYDAGRGRRLWSRATPRTAQGVVSGGGRVYVSGGCRV